MELDSFEGFRAYSLDTLGRLDEAISLGKDVLSGRVPGTVLPIVFKELKWSLSADDAALTIAPRECDVVASSLEGTDLTISEKVDRLRLLKLRLYPRYLEELTKIVEDSVNDPARRISLLASTGYLTSHLINDGHSREFLLHRLDERFFSQAIKKVGAAVVRAFIAGFAKERNNYKVIYGVNKTIEGFVTGRPAWTIGDATDLPAFVQAEVSTWTGGHARFATHDVFASDPFKAANLTDTELERFKAFTLIPTYRVRAGWSSDCVVHRPRGTQALALMRVNRPLQSAPPSAQGASLRLQQLVSLFKKMEKSFDALSKERVSRAIAAAHVATKSTQDEARLLSLWSAFEVLLSEPNREDVRILHFVKHLVPCICIKYHRRVFAAVYSELHQAYGPQLRALLNSPSMIGTGALYTKFARMIVQPQFENERQALLTICENNPLALHRLFRLEKFYGTPRVARSTIEDHANRVRWQLHRIYRVRNSLVHAGTAPEYTDTLVTNSLEYLRSCLTNLIRVAAKHELPSEIDLVISEVGLEWSLQLDGLGDLGNGPFDDQTARKLFGPL